MNLIDEEIDRQKEIVVRMRKLNSEVIAQRDKLAEALLWIVRREKINNPTRAAEDMARQALQVLTVCGLSNGEGK